MGGRIWLRHCLSCFYLLILFSLPCGACMCWHAHVSAWGATNMADISLFLAYTFAHTAVAVGGREGLMSAWEHVLHPIFLNIEIQLLIFHLASSALVSREKTLNTQSTRMPSFFLSFAFPSLPLVQAFRLALITHKCAHLDPAWTKESHAKPLLWHVSVLAFNYS